MRRITRRTVLAGMATWPATWPALSGPSHAQGSYPNRPVRLVVGFPAGGVGDITARLIGQRLSDRLGQPFIIENRPGAGGNIGTEAVIRAPADGYTLFLVNTANAVNASLYDNLSFNFIRDMAPVASVASAPNVMEVTSAFPAKNVSEFIAYAKANPGKINMASGGIGTLAQMCGELFKMMTGVNLTHVPYRGGGPALNDLVGGQVQVTFEALPASIALIRSGKIRALAVTTATRSPTLPDVPTIADTVPGYEASGWFGLGTAKNVSAEIIDKLNAEVRTILAEDAFKARLADLGGTALPLSPAGFGKLIAEDTEKWAKVVKFSGAKAN
jgi:tripartite-type tricarboxylate transporter receptor subunit TctC